VTKFANHQIMSLSNTLLLGECIAIEQLIEKPSYRIPFILNPYTNQMFMFVSLSCLNA